MTYTEAGPRSLSRSRAEDIFGRDLTSQMLGIRLEDVSPGRANLHMRVTVSMVNGHGVAQAVERTRQGRSGVYDVTVRSEDGTVIAEFRGHSVLLAGGRSRLRLPE